MRVYVHYSFGGYNIYYVDNSTEDILDKEVTNDNNYEFPASCFSFFQNAGCKLAYWKMPNGEYDLVVKGITCKENPELRCAVQFIASPEEKSILDNMTYRILSDLNEFSDFFASLFEKRNGLYMKKQELLSYIEECKDPKYFNSQISNLKNDIKVFIPTSKKIYDKTIQSEVSLSFFGKQGLTYKTLEFEGIENAYTLEHQSSFINNLPYNNSTTEEVKKKLENILNNLHTFITTHLKTVVVLCGLSVLTVIASVKSCTNESQNPSSQETLTDTISKN